MFTSQQVAAAPVTVQLTGAIQAADLALSHYFSGGGTLTARLTFDSTDVYPTDLGTGVYRFVESSAVICDSSSRCYQMAADARQLAPSSITDYSVSLYGGHSIGAYAPMSAAGPGLPSNPMYPFEPPPVPSMLNFYLGDVDGRALVSDHLDGPAVFREFEQTGFSLVFASPSPAGPRGAVRGRLTSFATPNAVPEPGTMSVVVLGLVSLATLRRRSTKRQRECLAQSAQAPTAAFYVTPPKSLIQKEIFLSDPRAICGLGPITPLTPR